MRIALVGGGAIGSYYAALLTRSGLDVRLLTRGAHLDALRAKGLLLRTTTARRAYPYKRPTRRGSFGDQSSRSWP